MAGLEKNISRYELFRRRSQLITAIRNFLTESGYLEAEVPILAPSVIPEGPIELFKTEYRNPYGVSKDMYLLPSPEYYLKQLIADGCGDIFNISKCFRNSEQIGRIHNPEFSMLEYYTMEADAEDSIRITEKLFSRLLDFVQEQWPETVKKSEWLRPPFTRISMTEAFEKHAALDISDFCTGKMSKEEEIAAMIRAAEGLGLSCSGAGSSAENSDYSWEELFNLIFVHSVEPNLDSERPLVLYDYPSGIPTLAKPSKIPGRLQRWELYAGGVELANCYSEETDYERAVDFFRKENEEKQAALVSLKADESWCEIFKKGFPDCSGVALGIDRLMMLILDSSSLEGVILFPFSAII